MRKTAHLLAFEKKHGRPAAAVLREAINEHGSIAAAARVLGISHNTLFGWTVRCGVKVKTVWTGPARGENGKFVKVAS